MKTACRLFALASMVSAVAATSQALAATQLHRSGYDAYARAGDAESGVSEPRANAIRDCSGEMNKLVQKDWGVTQNIEFSSCMTQRHEVP